MAPDRPFGEVHDEQSLGADFDWTVLSSLLVADQLTNRVLEDYLLRIYHDGSEEYDELAHLEEMIAYHREIIDQLELAKDLVDERANGQ